MKCKSYSGILLLFLLASSICFSQKKGEDLSIQDKILEIERSKNDSLKSVLYNQISKKARVLKDKYAQKRFADSAFKYAQKTTYSNLQFRSILSQINAAIIFNDTLNIYQLFRKGFSLKKTSNLSELNDDFLRFRIRNIAYLLKWNKLTSEEALKDYQEIYTNLKKTDKYFTLAEVVGKISLVYRNRKELHQALIYNNLELKFADKVGDYNQIASGKITELDLSYQLIPRPIKPEDVVPLIKKAEAAEAFMQKHQILNILPFAKLYLAKFYIYEANYKKGEEVLLSLNDSLPARVVFSKYEQLSEIAKSTQDLKKYRDYTLKFKPVAYETRRPFVALNVHNYLLDYSLKSHQKDSALFYAKKLEENLQQVDTTQFLDYVYFTYDVLSTHYIDLNKDKSIRYKTYANNITSQIVAKQKEAFVNIIKYREKVENLETENSNLSSAVSFFKNNFFSIIVVAVILLILVLYYFKAYKKSDETTKKITKEAKEVLKKVEKESIILNNKQKLYLEEIQYIKSDRNYVEFYLEEKKIIDRNLLKIILEQLPPNFVKVHRSYVVNKNYIKVINSSSLLLKSNIEIPISRTFKSNLNL